jgi:translation initiation factor 1 (eIF-1/SUI1)
MSLSLPDPGQPTKRAFWSKPEGVTGAITLLACVAAAVVVFNVFGPALLGALTIAIGLVGKAITLGALSVVAFLGFLLVTNKRVHTLVEYFFKSGMRKVTGAFVEIDPIGIMKNFVGDLKDRRAVMADSIKKLNGQLTVVQEKVTDNVRNADQAMKMAAEAKKQGNSAVMSVNSNQYGRLTGYNERLQGVLDKMTVLLKMLRKYYDASGAVIADLTNEVNIQEDQRKMMFSAYSAMTSAREIIMGEGDKRELFDLAMESVKDNYGQKLGEIEDFMTVSQSFIDGVDIQNGVFAEDALKKIEAWESKVDSLLLGNDKRQILETHGMTTTAPFNANSLGNDASADYAKLFGNKR